MGKIDGGDIDLDLNKGGSDWSVDELEEEVLNLECAQEPIDLVSFDKRKACSGSSGPEMSVFGLV